MLSLCFHPQSGPYSRSQHSACTSRSWTHKHSCAKHYFPHPYSDKSCLLIRIDSSFCPPITNERTNVQYELRTNPNAILRIQLPNHRAGGGICEENEWERIALMEVGAQSENKQQQTPNRIRFTVFAASAHVLPFFFFCLSLMFAVGSRKST